MAVTQALTTSFKAEILQAVHNLAANGDTFKIALYSSSANISSSAAGYTTDGEISGGSYVAGGKALTNLGVSSSGTVAYTSWDNAVWANAGFSAAGALIYNASKGNKSVAVLNFGGTYTWDSTATATITFPANNSTTAVVIIN